MEKWYRIRCRDKKGKSYVVNNYVENLEIAYALITLLGKQCHQSRKFYIDEVTPKMFSVVTAKVAEKRYLEIQKVEEND